MSVPQSTQDSKELVRRFIDMVNAHKEVIVLDQFFGRDYLSHNEELPPGLAGVGQYIAMLRTGFPDGQFTIDELRTEDDKVVVRTTFRGTHQGNIWGFPPTGKEVAVTSTDSWRVQADKLVEHWGGLDRAALAEQLGVKPTPVPEGGEPPMQKTA